MLRPSIINDRSVTSSYSCYRTNTQLSMQARQHPDLREANQIQRMVMARQVFKG